MPTITKNKFFSRYLPMILSVVLLIAGGLSYLVFSSKEEAKGTWYSSSWSYRKKISIDPNKVSGATGHTDFPMLFSRTDPDLRSVASGGKMGRQSAKDAVFVDWEGNKLSHEIETYASSTGELISWVKVPYISSTSTREIYMYYGNASAADQQNATGVWDTNYKGVWHLPDGTTLTANDSTGVNNGSISGAVAIAGKVDGAGSFDGSDDYVDIGDNPSLGITGNLTISAWMKADTFTSSNDNYAVSKYANGANSYMLFATYDNSVRQMALAISSVGADDIIRYTATSVTTGTWYHVVGVFNAGIKSLDIYLNGVFDNGALLGTIPSSIYDSVTPLLIGKRTVYGTRLWDGSIDDVRISSTTRSADWIKTEYNNQSLPTTFFGYGGQEAQSRMGPGGGGTAPAVKARGGVKSR